MLAPVFNSAPRELLGKVFRSISGEGRVTPPGRRVRLQRESVTEKFSQVWRVRNFRRLERNAAPSAVPSRGVMLRRRGWNVGDKCDVLMYKDKSVFKDKSAVTGLKGLHY